MNRRRMVGGLLVIALSVLPHLAAAIPAQAQGSSSDVSLTLVSQTPWAALKDPLIEIAVKASNDGDTALIPPGDPNSEYIVIPLNSNVIKFHYGGIKQVED